jgi:23S rRNA G2445 N2-methylase RlmL
METINNRYLFKIASGTNDFVLKELKEKFDGRYDVINNYKNVVEIISEVPNIDDFRVLKSVLHVVKNGGLTRNLFRREWKRESVPAGINPALAYILCQIAEISEDDVILDPFCGAGTIGISAGLYFNPKKILCSDVSGQAIDMATVNLNASKLDTKKITFFRSNISQLTIAKDTITKVITNMPFGIRVGNHEQNLKLYRSFADQMKGVVKKDGLLVLYTSEKELLNTVLDKKSFKFIKEFQIEQGGLFPSIFVIKKIN